MASKRAYQSDGCFTLQDFLQGLLASQQAWREQNHTKLVCVVESESQLCFWCWSQVEFKATADQVN